MLFGERIKILLKMFITSGLITLSRGTPEYLCNAISYMQTLFFVLEFHK